MGCNVGLTTTEVGGVMKINLHESGSWQIGFTSEHERRQREDGTWDRESRHWEIWQRPREATPGYTAAIKIVISPYALRERPAPEKKKRVRWIDVRPGQGVSFMTWLAKSSVPAWGYGEEHDILGTIPLPNSEYVLLTAHFIDANAATTAALRGLAGFMGMLMTRDTACLEPFSADATLMGLSPEPTGVRAITEIPLWALQSVTKRDEVEDVEQAPTLEGFDDDLASGFLNVPAPVPHEVFVERGIDPSVDPVRAQEIVAEWNDAKIKEVQRLFGLTRSG